MKPEKKDINHWSDCAVNNGPAYEPGECDCGGSPGVHCEGKWEFNTAIEINGTSVPPLIKSKYTREDGTRASVFIAQLLNEKTCDADGRYIVDCIAAFREVHPSNAIIIPRAVLPELNTVIARSIGNSMDQQNHKARADEVWRDILAYLESETVPKTPR